MGVLDLLEAECPPKIEPLLVGKRAYYVRGMLPTQRAAFSQLLMQAMRENSEVPDHVIAAWGLCEDAAGKRPDVPQEELLRRLHDNVDPIDLNKIARKVLELSGFGAKAVEKAEKNAEPAGAAVPVPAGAGSRKDRRAAAARTRSKRRH